MDASERRALRRRIARGSVGVAVVATLIVAAGISEDGLSWATVGTAVFIVVFLAALIPLFVVITEAFREATRPRDE